MPRQNEEPDWSTSDGSSSGDESHFADEGSEGNSSYDDEGSEEGSETGSSGSESGSRSDYGADDFSDEGSSGSESRSASGNSSYDDRGSEEGSETGSSGGESASRSDYGTDDFSDEGSSGSESRSASGSDYSSSDDSDDSSEDDESMEDVSFDDEENWKDRGMSTGDLMNEPNTDPAWMKFVPAKIAAMGVRAAAIFLICVIAIPLIFIIGLSAGLSGGKKDDTMAPTTSPVSAPEPEVPVTPAPTVAPTAAPVLRATVLTSDATNTIYREGIRAEVTSGGEETMLVQNGPPGDAELPSAYSLVQFEGIAGIDSDILSVDAYLSSIEDLSVQFCLTVAENEGENKKTYSTCLLPPSSTPQPVNELSGVTSPDYNIPGDCVNEQVITFEVDSSTTEVCLDVAALLQGASDASLPTENTDLVPAPDQNPSLRGRKLEQDMSLSLNGVVLNYLFMIDSLEESDQRGTQFFSSNAPNGRAPTLVVEGGNTCKTAADIACSEPEFSTLCDLVKKAELIDALDRPYTTVFAPTNDAFDSLADVTLDALNDASVLNDALQYHLVSEKIMSGDLNCNSLVGMRNDQPTTTLCGADGAFYQVGTGVSQGVNSFPEIINADIETCFGVIHVIDQVLIPTDTQANTTCISEDDNQTIAELCTLPEFSTLCSMFDTVGFLDLLSNGLYTIFAPTNEAFQKALATLGPLLGTDSDTGVITNVVLQHIISGSDLFAADLSCDTSVEMSNGNFNNITCENDEFFISGPGNDPGSLPRISDPDRVGCNVVIHFVDEVILPEIETPSDEGEAGGEYTPCGICGAGMAVTLPDVTIPIPDSVGLPAQNGDVTCEMADMFCRSGGCSQDTCAVFAEGMSSACGCEESNTVSDFLLSNADTYSILLDLASRADLVETLTNTEGITVFAPTNDAFGALAESSSDLVANLRNDDEWITHLRNLLLYHVLAEEIPSSDITDDSTKEAINGEAIVFKVNADGEVFVNEIKVTNADAETENGVIHTIEGVLLPSWVNKNIVDVIEENSDLSATNDLIADANLGDTLSSGGPFTVFAPSNGAIENAGDLGLEDTDTLTSLLNYHVVPGIYPESAISDGASLTTATGSDVILNLIGGTPTVNGVRIVSTDTLANNGIVHIIDGVLQPPDLGPGEMAETQACSICSGNNEDLEWSLRNPGTIITFPENVDLSTNLEGNEATCDQLDQLCSMGFCSTEICQAFSDSGAKETCGCEQ